MVAVAAGFALLALAPAAEAAPSSVIVKYRANATSAQRTSAAAECSAASLGCAPSPTPAL
jgi:hypothetical protein